MKIKILRPNFEQLTRDSKLDIHKGQFNLVKIETASGCFAQVKFGLELARLC